MSDFKSMVARYALQKHVLKTLTDESKLLGSDITDTMRELYVAGGVKQVSAEVDGRKVGTLSATVAKPKSELAVTDQRALYDWALENGFTSITVDMGRIQANFERTGEVPDGCRVEERGGGFKSVTVRFDKEAKENIRRLMDESALGEAVRGLLGGD